MTDPLVSQYLQNRDYEPHFDGSYWLLRDAGGWGLACDEPVYRIWSAFDGRPTGQVIPEASLNIGMPVPFVESTTKVLARAGLLQPSEPLGSMEHNGTSGPVSLESFPLVSVIVLAGPQARPHLETCLPSVVSQTYPNLDVILVDNQTKDDSVAFVREHLPQIQVLSTEEPLGFDAANNMAMKKAQGEFLFLLNDDTEMTSGCVATCMDVMSQSEEIACVVPKMKLFYMRSFINSIGNSLYPDGLSCDNYVGYLDVGQFDTVEEVFSACFGAALLRRSVVEEIGFMDERYSWYFEDMDWSYRARIHGYEIVAAPEAIVYHKFNATMEKLASAFKLGLVARNRLRFIWKNLSLGRALRLTRIYWRESLRHVGWALDKGRNDIVRAYLSSWGQWLRSLPELAMTRRQVRRRRRPPFTEDAAFALVDNVPRPTMYGRFPIVAVPVIQNHYMQLEVFKPDSAMPGDLPPLVERPALEPRALLLKAGQVLREKGILELAKETRQYLLWRFAITHRE
jgi:GT2 family glycosyltransferase